MDEERKIRALYNFYLESLFNPRISKKSFHEKHSPYATLNASTRLLEDAFQKEIFTGPYLYCNRGISVELTKNCNGFELYEKRIHDPKVTYAMALMGEHSLLVFSKGASTLDYAICTKPSLRIYTSFEDIQFDERGIGELPPDPYPVGWGEMEWAVYDLMKNPRIPYLKVAPELKVSWDTVKYYFNRVLKQCKVFMGFFPRTYSGYQHMFLTFETKYEIGLLEELSKLDRSSYVYKFNKTLILILFVERYNDAVKKFKEIENNGFIRNLCASIPYMYEKP